MLENRELLVVVTTPEGKVYNHRSYSVSAEAIDGGITITSKPCANHVAVKNW